MELTFIGICIGSWSWQNGEKSSLFAINLTLYSMLNLFELMSREDISKWRILLFSYMIDFVSAFINTRQIIFSLPSAWKFLFQFVNSLTIADLAIKLKLRGIFSRIYASFHNIVHSFSPNRVLA